MKRLCKNLIFLACVFLISGCYTISNAPTISQIDKDNNYITVVNSVTYIFLYDKPISARNVVVKCNAKSRQCEELRLWDETGYRIY